MPETIETFQYGDFGEFAAVLELITNTSREALRRLLADECRAIRLCYRGPSAWQMFWLNLERQCDHDCKLYDRFVVRTPDADLSAGSGPSFESTADLMLLELESPLLADDVLRFLSDRLLGKGAVNVLMICHENCGSASNFVADSTTGGTFRTQPGLLTD